MEQGRNNIILVGFMGAGKTVVGQALSRRLGCAFLDTDRLITLLTGDEPASIISQRGEGAFRNIEQEALRRASMLCHTVIATGGGSLLSRDASQQLRRSGTLVWLRASLDVLRSRVGSGPGRPLWSSDPEQLLRSRESLYGIADLIVDTDQKTPAQVCDTIAEHLDLRDRDTNSRSSRVDLVPGSTAIIGSGLPVSQELMVASEGRSVVVAADPLVMALYGEAIAEGLRSGGLSVHHSPLPDGETGKTWDRVGQLIEDWSSFGLNRDDLAVAVGGGAASDAVGFAASCYMRGISVAYVATTLLSAVDAAIGGKTGVNAGGIKNLAGTFHQPKLVVIDTRTLLSLPEREWRSGLGELLKYGVGLDRQLFDLLVTQADRIRDRDPELVAELVGRAVRLKAEICREDERERGKRELLNLGHTAGHVLEASPGLGLTHGEAVGLGIIVAARLAERQGVVKGQLSSRVKEAVDRLGLAVGISGDRVSPSDMNRMLRLDKKRREGELRMVLPVELGRTAVVPVPAGLVCEEMARLWS